MKLEGRDIACMRAGREVLRGVSFSLAAGECLALTGPNGAGKTTLLRLIAGLLRPSAGTIRLDGGDGERTLGEQAHYLGHSDAIKPALTVGENLAFWSVMLGGRPDAPCAAALEAAGLSRLVDFPAAVLSAGQRRRLALARLLAAPRPVWLLDEPLTALDSDGRARLAEEVRRHLEGGGMAIAATHTPMPHATGSLKLGGAA